MCEVGSIVLVPHIFLSSHKHFRKAGLEGSRVSRTYEGLSKGGGCDAVTHLIQVINQRYQIIVYKVPHASLIFFPVKDVAEFIVKPRRGTVEEMEPLQEIG